MNAYSEYPNTWYVIARSDEVRPAKVLTRRICGNDVTLYRTRGGVLRAIDPVCPHMGAHLGHGGTVEGEVLFCPFHRFGFNTDGACIKTPISTKPPKARLTQHHIDEHSGLIYFWHHSAGEPPTWKVDALELEQYPVARTSVITSRAHTLSLMENAADRGHFHIVHGLRTSHIAAPFRPDGPRATMEYEFPGSLARIQLQGPCIVHLEMRYPTIKLTERQIIALTPIEGGTVTFSKVNRARTDARVPRVVAAIVNHGATSLFQFVSNTELKKDTKIWRHQKLVEHPRFAADDKSLADSRLWARQFFGANTTE